MLGCLSVEMVTLTIWWGTWQGGNWIFWSGVHWQSRYTKTLRFFIIGVKYQLLRVMWIQEIQSFEYILPLQQYCFAQLRHMYPLHIYSLYFCVVELKQYSSKRSNYINNHTIKIYLKPNYTAIILIPVLSSLKNLNSTRTGSVRQY